MKQNVVIKSNKYGIVLQMNAEIPYEELLDEIREKFHSSARFFRGAQMAITFEGRVLEKKQEDEIIGLISEIAQVEILCIFDRDACTERLYEQAVEQSLESLPRKDGQFYRGTLKSRQLLEMEKSVIILGDVEFGAQVVSKGSVVVIGTIRGSVHAGTAGDHDAFIAALALKPQHLQIADVPAKDVYLRKSERPEAKIARVVEGTMTITPLRDQELGV